MIEVTFVLNQKTLDVLVPNKITFKRLSSLLKEALDENGSTLPDNFQLKFADKTFQMGETDILRDFGVSNGDRLEILAGEISETI